MLATSVETLPFAHLLSSSKSGSDLVQQFDDNDGQDGSGDGDIGGPVNFGGGGGWCVRLRIGISQHSKLIFLLAFECKIFFSK